MIPSEIRGIHYLTPDNPILISQNPNAFLHDDVFPNLHVNDLFGTSHHHHHELNVVPSSSTSDEAEEHQISMIDERKLRRMISNRESARRSRMRKQKHMDELWSQVVRLRTENHNLVHRLNHASKSHDRVLQENAKLREEASDLRQMVADLQIWSSFSNALTDFDELSLLGN